jgi:hypothetical protein
MRFPTTSLRSLDSSVSLHRARERKALDLCDRAALRCAHTSPGPAASGTRATSGIVSFRTARLAMLSFYRRLAARLLPRRGLLWAAVLACLLGFILLSWRAGAPRDSAWALACITLMLWLLLLLAIAHAFAGSTIAAPSAGPFEQRLRSRLRAAMLWLAALAMTGLAGTVLLFTLRALGVIVGTIQ